MRAFEPAGEIPSEAEGSDSIRPRRRRGRILVTFFGTAEAMP